MASTLSRCREPSTTCLITSGRLVTRPRGLRSTGSMSHPNLVAITTWPLYGASASPTSFLVGVGTVDLGGVEEGDATVHRGPDERDHLLPVGLVAVATGHAHTAQPDRRDFQAGPKSALLHRA